MGQILDQYYGTSLQGLLVLASDASTKAAETFYVPYNIRISSASFNLVRAGSPTGNVNYAIYALSGTPGSNALPTGTALATTNTYNVATIPTTATGIELSFTGSVVLTPGYYAIAAEYSGGSFAGSNYISTQLYTPDETTRNASRYISSAWTTSSVGTYEIPFTVYQDEVSRIQAGSVFIRKDSALYPVLGAVGGYGSWSVGDFQAGKAAEDNRALTTRTQSGNVRIRTVVSRTQVGNVRIDSSAQLKTQLGNVRITAQTTKTQLGNVRVTKTTLKTQSGSVVIAYQNLVHQIGNVNLASTTDRTQVGNVALVQQPTREQYGNVMIYNYLINNGNYKDTFIKTGELEDTSIGEGLYKPSGINQGNF